MVISSNEETTSAHWTPTTDSIHLRAWAAVALGRPVVSRPPAARLSDYGFSDIFGVGEKEGNVTVTDESLLAEIREKAMSLGASYFGVADLAPVRPFITDQGDDFLTEYPVGVSVGVALTDGLVDQLHQHFNGNVARTYRHHIYSAVAEHLDRLAADLVFTIESNGCRAIPVPSSGHYDQTLLRGLTSHKLVAHLAGLIVLTEDTAEVAPGEKDSPGPHPAAQHILFPQVREGAGHLGIAPHPAYPKAVGPAVHPTAQPRTHPAGGAKVGEGLLHLLPQPTLFVGFQIGGGESLPRQEKPPATTQPGGHRPD